MPSSNIVLILCMQCRDENWHELLQIIIQKSCADSIFLLVHLQGIELENPNARAGDADMKSGTESYFSEYSGFRSLSLPPPPK